MDYDSSSSNDNPHYVNQYNRNCNRWIDCNDVTAEDFDIISTRLSHTPDKVTDQTNNWKNILRNIIRSYKYIVNLLKQSKDVSVYKRIFHRHRKRNDFFAFEMRQTETITMMEAEKEWFKREYARQVGEPKPQDEELLMDKATAGLELQAKFIPFDRICYAPPMPHVSTLQQVDWKDTPLAITCDCPNGICTCNTRKISILPPAKIPYKFRPDFFGIKPFCWSIHFKKYPKPAGTLVPKLVETVQNESEYYRSQEGRTELEAKGPEFCMSGCLQYLVSSLALDAALAAEIAKMQATIDVGGLKKMGAGPGEPSISADICDEFHCSVATQTENDPDTEELIVGDYSKVLYGNTEDSVMNDVEGMKLQISSYSRKPPDPCALTIGRVLHVQEIKETISKIKELYSTFSAAKGSYCCKDVSCQIKGLSFIESIGGMFGKCKCGEDIKDEELQETAPEVPEFDIPPLLQKVIDIKHEIKDFIKKYFTRIETPHPCSQKARIDAIKKKIMEKNAMDNKDLQDVLKNAGDIKLNDINNKNIPQCKECQFTVDNYSRNVVGGFSKAQEIKPSPEIDKDSIKSIPQKMKLNVLDTLPISEDKSIDIMDVDFTHKTSNRLVSDIYKGQSGESNFVTKTSSLIKTTFPKNSHTSAGNLRKSEPSQIQLENDSQELGSSGVFVMISKKVSRSGWKGWFSFSSEGDKSVIDSKTLEGDNTMSLLKQVKNKESAIRKYKKIVKHLDKHQSDDSTEEVVQNIQSYRNLKSSHSAGNKEKKISVLNTKKSEPKLPQHYRFYF